MMRGLSCLIISAGIIFWTFRLAAKGDRKIRAYRKIKQRLEHLSKAVGRGEMLEEALQPLPGEEPDCMGRIAERVSARRGEDLAAIWQEEWQKEAAEWEPEELAQLLSLGTILGCGDRWECSSRIAYVQDYMIEREKTMGAELKERGGLYRKLGLLGALLAVVFFL